MDHHYPLRRINFLGREVGILLQVSRNETTYFFFAPPISPPPSINQFFSHPLLSSFQSENGPCPLLAICNVLLLRNQIRIHADVGRVSFSSLVTLLANRLIEANPSLSASAVSPPGANGTNGVGAREVLSE